MKKRLMLMMTAVMGMAVSSFAYERGDVVYTHSGKFKIQGENLLPNGDFSKGMESWTGLTGNPMSADTFKVYNEGGPDGKPYVEVQIAGGTMGATLHNSPNFRNSVRIPAGNYVFTYKVKIMLGGVSSNARWSGRNDNYQDVYINSDGNSPYPTETDDNKIQASIAEWVDAKADKWTDVAYYYHADADVYINTEFFNLKAGDCFADFGVYPVNQMGDDRILQDGVKTLEAIIADKENFPGADEALSEPLADLKANLDNPELTVEDVTSMLNGILGTDGSALQGYLEGISADVSGYFNHFTFDDCTEKGENKGAAEGWTETGGRWGVRGPWSDFDTRHIFAGTPAPNGFGKGSQYQISRLPKGKYLYMVKASAYKLYANGTGNSNDKYIPDYYNQYEGLGYFINADTVEMKDVPTWKSNTYMHVFDVKEDGEQTIGFYRDANAGFAGNDRNKVSGGGRVYFDNMHIRILSLTDDDVKQFFLDNNFAASQNSLKVMIDSAKTVIGKPGYIWGKTVLQDSITVSENVYATVTKATEENIDILNAQMPYMRQAIRDYYTINAEYKQLGDDIASSKVLVADEARPQGKAELNAAINTADTYYKSLNADSERDSLTLVKTDSTLMAACLTFYVANASFHTPAVLNLVNADFSDDTKGWSVDGASGTAVWKTGNMDFPTYKGRGVYFNRGYTATDNKYIWQDVLIEKTGVYKFSATCAVHNSSWNSVEGNITSTYLFAGKDSVNLITVGPGKKEQAVGEFAPFEVETRIKSLDSEDLIIPGYLRVGLEKRALEDGTNVSVNIIYMAEPKLLYYGSEEAYDTGVTDVEVVDGVFDIYNLNGMKVRSNAASLNGLAKGIYIVNGKKYVVK